MPQGEHGIDHVPGTVTDDIANRNAKFLPHALTFRFTQLDDPPCKVIHELKEVEGGVEYLMILENVPKGTKTEKWMMQGGTMIVNTLKAVVETGRPSFGVRLVYRLFPLFELFTPSRCRSEHWPL